MDCRGGEAVFLEDNPQFNEGENVVYKKDQDK